MCYSALVKQDLKNYGLKWATRMDYQLILDMFELRRKGKKLNVPKAFEKNFKNPTTPIENKILKSIEEYRENQILELEADLFKQKTRHNNAIETLKMKKTKKFENERDVSERQIDRIKKRLERIKESKPKENDSRIYAFDYSPVIVLEKGKRVVKPMRYHLRPGHMEESFDRKFPGCYNARRDSLTKFWKPVFGKNHGVIIVDAFFENVKKHDLEKWKLKSGEEEENVVIKFTPKGADYMVIPCIWDKWVRGDEELYSFALITDEPPAEVLETGHDRCPIFLNEKRIDDWLNCDGKTQEQLFEILDDRQTPFYEHALAG